MNLKDVPQELLEDFGADIKYYAGRICSCTANNDGAYDPGCGCFGGFRYRDPVEYRLIRTSIRYDKLTERAGQILEGGCLLVIPKETEGYNAHITGKKDLSTGADLSSDNKLKISIDNNAAVEINCATGADDTSSVKLQRIIHNINTGLEANVARETSKNGGPGRGYLTLASTLTGDPAEIEILKPSGNDAIDNILGLNAAHYPYRFTALNSGAFQLPVYHSLSVGDVFVMKNRNFRDSAICQKGINDTIRAFDIDDVLLVSKKETIYKRDIDYTVSGNTVNWVSGGNAPADGEYYSVEHRLPLQYIIYNDMGADRGADHDQPAKKVMAALRNYINSQNLTIDNL